MKNRRPRAVIVFEADDFGVWPVFFESQDVLDLGAAPAIDGLIIVTHNAEISMALGQGLDDAVLEAVGVLVFVDQQMIEARGLGEACLGKPPEQLLGLEQ